MKNFLLIDDHEIVRYGVKTVLLELFKPCEIFEASNEKEALEQFKARKYDLIIMDVQMPDTDSAGLLKNIKIKTPDAKVLVFSMSAENLYAKRFMKLGAMGFVTKNSGLSELIKAINLALNNRKYISEAFAEILAGEAGDEKSSNPFESLSSREFEIVSLIIHGKSLNEISDLLSIHSSTVSTHKSRLLEKLGVKNLPELLELARAFNLNFSV
ncbi:MAG TPA: response regulator transcription factor [Ferruginibacter sp.]|nr:response regulator transcription factor [Ferruginibacter sp.]